MNQMNVAALAATEHAATLVEEMLPFTVRLVKTADDLSKAVHVRHSAYGRHLPQFAESLRMPEKADAEPGIVVLLAQSKLDGSALGTMRIQTNTYSRLALEQSIDLPDWLQPRVLAEASRLGIVGDRVGRLVKTALFKAFYEYSMANAVEWMVITGRSPIDRQYEHLMFEDVYPGTGFIPLQHVSNLPHRIMALEVAQVYPKWKAANHPLFNYFFNTRHVDIDVGTGAETPNRPIAMSSPVLHAETAMPNHRETAGLSAVAVPV